MCHRCQLALFFVFNFTPKLANHLSDEWDQTSTGKFTSCILISREMTLELMLDKCPESFQRHHPHLGIYLDPKGSVKRVLK